MTKKILSLILCFSLILPACVITPTVSATVSGDVIDVADFENGVAWSPLAMHSTYVSDITNTVVDVAGRGKVLNMEIGSGTSGTVAYGIPLEETDARVVALPTKYSLEFDVKAVAKPATLVVHVSRGSTPMEVRLAPDGFEVGDWYHYVITFDESTTTPASAITVKRKNITDNGEWQTCEPVGTSATCSANAPSWSINIFNVANGGYRAQTTGITGGGSFGLAYNAFLIFGTMSGKADGWSEVIGDRPGSIWQLDNIKIAYGTAVSGVTFDPQTTIPSSGEVTASFALSNFGGLASAEAVIAGYDKNGQMIAGSSTAKTLTEGSSTVTASLTSSAALADGGWIETFLWNPTTNEIINGGYGALGTPAAVGTTTETEKMVRSTKANTFTVEGTTSASAPITVIAKQGSNLLAASHFTAKTDGTYSKTFGISPELCTNGTATVTVYGADTTAKTFDIPVYSNWDAMVAAFKAMDEETEAESFFTTYENNFKYYAAGSDTLATDLTAISDYAGIALLNSKRIYADEITYEEVIDAALDLVASLPDIATFEADFAAAKAEATEAEQIAAIKDLITTTTLITFDFDGVFNKDAVAKALISSTATSLADIYNDFITARDTQKGIEQSTATAFRAVTDAATLEAFFVDNQTTLGIDPTPFAGYWEVMYGVYVEKSYSTCADADVNAAIQFLGDYVDDYKVFMENIIRAAKTNKNWEAIKAVLNGDNGNVTVTLAAGTGTVVETDEIYKRLIDMDCTSLAVVEAAYTAAWTEQANLENDIYNEVWGWLETDKATVKTFLENYGELLGVPQTATYTDTQNELFAERYNATLPPVSNYADTKTAIQTLVAEVATAEAFIADVNAKAVADDRAGVEAVYEGAAYAGYFGAPAISVTDERELYTRIMDIAKATPFVVLSDVKAAFDQAHADQLSWEAQSGAYENPDDALLDFVSTAWKLDIRGNVVKLSGRVDGYGVYQLILYVEDGDGTPIFFKQIATDAGGMFEEEFGLNPEIENYTAGTDSATFRVAGEGVNTYVFSPFDLYTEGELLAPVNDFKAIANKTDIVNFFNNYKDIFDLPVGPASTPNDYTKIDVTDDRVLEALLFVYNKNNAAGKYDNLAECIDVLNGTEEDTGALALIATMQEMIKCLDDLTAAANEMVGGETGRWSKIKSQVEKTINNGWITPFVSGTVSAENEPDMYLAMAGKNYGYFASAGNDPSLAVVKTQYEAAYAAYATTGGTPAPGGGSGGSGGGGGASSGIGGGNKPEDNVSIGSNLNPIPTIDNPKSEHPAAPFKDISAEFSWAQDSIDRLRSYGVIQGDGDGNFRPGAGISREEFLSMLFKVFGIDTKASNSNFSDVNKNEWYYGAVSTAYNMGIVKGYTDGRFGIGDTISRADMAVMICRAMEVLNHDIEQTEVAMVFNDATKIPDYAYESIAKLQRAGILNGDTHGYYNPLDKVNRAESAVALWPIYVEVSGILPQ